MRCLVWTESLMKTFRTQQMESCLPQKSSLRLTIPSKVLGLTIDNHGKVKRVVLLQKDCTLELLLKIILLPMMASRLRFISTQSRTTAKAWVRVSPWPRSQTQGVRGKSGKKVRSSHHRKGCTTGNRAVILKKWRELSEMSWCKLTSAIKQNNLFKIV